MAMVNSLIGRDKELLVSAVDQNSIMLHLSRFLGPAIGGFIIVTWGVKELFLCNLFTFAYFCFVLAFKVTLTKVHGTYTKSDCLLAEIRERTRYAVTHPSIGLILLLITANAIFLRGYLDLLPSISEMIFNG